jgi:uridylate kinase
MAKSGVDGVYDADPRKDPSATKFDTITYADAIQRNLEVVDQTAFTLCAENKLPMVVFGMEPEGNIPAPCSRVRRSARWSALGLTTPAQPAVRDDDEREQP